MKGELWEKWGAFYYATVARMWGMCCDGWPIGFDRRFVWAVSQAIGDTRDVCVSASLTVWGDHQYKAHLP